MNLRPMLESDRSLVINSWVRSYSERSNEARDYTGAAMGMFGRDYTRVVLGLLERSEVTVACLASNPDSVLGWMCWEGDEILHYILTKQRWRKLGVATWMLQELEDMPVVYTHRTRETLKCPVPKAWSYRRWCIWPKGAA